MRHYLLSIFLCASFLGLAQTNSTNSDSAARPTPTAISLLWDTSLPLKSRNTAQEFELLKSYIATLGTVQINVSKFSSSIYETKGFNCSLGCQDLYEYLGNSEYNGASNYAELLQKNTSKADLVLFYTNGITLFEALDSQLKIPVFLINSKKEANHAALKELADATDGAYINLTVMSVENALSYLTNVVDSEENYDVVVADGTVLYYGVVHNSNNPIQGATVKVKNTFTEVQTESNGRYKISAKPGDVLEISALGMEPKEVVLTETQKTHVPLTADGELLEEVLLRQKKKDDEERVKTAFGEKSRNSVGYLTQSITKDQISQADINAFEVLFRQPGIELYQGSLYFTKAISINRTPILIYLDGAPVEASILRSLDARLIEDIVQLKTLASTVRYGQLGVGGVIQITTVNSKEADGILKKENTALVKGNEYTESVPIFEFLKAAQPKSNYVLALEKSTSFEAAKDLYYKQLKYERNNIDYYLAVAPYFKKWNPEFSNSVLSNIAAVAPSNVKALKILAYSYEENNKPESARYIYEQLINLQPKDIQSYRDLALIYAQTGEYELAATLYRQMLYNTIPNVDFAPIQDAVINEFRHLIKNHKSKINYKGLPNELLSLEYKKDIRIVLEWNQPATEFDVQIVNPESKYFNFSHTAFNNKELLQQEIDEGFYMKEFIIDDGEKGNWMVNIRYNGQGASNIPLLMKYTLFKNYGTPNETSVIKTIQLDQYQDKMTLDSFLNSID